MKLLLLLLALLLQVFSRKLILVQNLFRHGARYPIFFNDQDNTTQPHIKHYGGELTTQGKNMHYLLGKILYKKYWKALFQGTQAQFKYDPKQIYIKSTYFNRTIQSAQSQLRGWLQNLTPLTLQPKDINYSLPAFQNIEKFVDLSYTQNKWNVFTQTPKYQSIPIHTSGASQNKPSSNPYDQGDYLIKYDKLECPKQVNWTKQNFNSPLGKAFQNMPQVKQALQILSQTYPNRNVSIQNAYKFVDSYDCMKYLGQKTLGIFQDPKYSRTFKYIAQFSLYLIFFHQPIQYQTIVTNLFEAIVNNFKNAIDGSGPKLILYSAHDTTIGLTLAALNLTNLNCVNDKYLYNAANQQTCVSDYPPFASNFIMQVYRQDNNTYTFQIVFNNIPRRIPFCNNQFVCPVQTFYSWVDSWKVADPNEQCGIKDELQTQQMNQKKQKGKLFIIIAIQVAIIIVLAVFVYHQYMKQISQKKQIQEYVSNFQKQDNQQPKEIDFQNK